jgi:hypothetical protein
LPELRTRGIDHLALFPKSQMGEGIVVEEGIEFSSSSFCRHLSLIGSEDGLIGENPTQGNRDTASFLIDWV